MSEISQYTESLHEECGVFGMYDKTGGTDMVSAVYSALYALQHRGQESCGIALNVDGVLSGSLSFIFGKLDEGMAFSEATQIARSNGFTEPDPRDDLNGMDVARKLLILAISHQ